MPKLPPSLRAQLADALALGDTVRLAPLLEKTREVSPGLADALAHNVAEFNYAPALEALEALDDDPPTANEQP